MPRLTSVIILIFTVVKFAMPQWTVVGKVPNTPYELSMATNNIGYVATLSGLYKTNNSGIDFSLCSEPHVVNDFSFDAGGNLFVSLLNTSSLKQEVEILSPSCNPFDKWYGKEASSLGIIDIHGDTIVTNYDDKNVLVSKDYGVNWDTLKMDSFQGRFLDFKILIDGSILCVTRNISQGNRLKRSVNLGKNWQWVNKGSNQNVIKILEERDRRVWLVGRDGLVAFSDDSGDKWNSLKAPMPYTIADGVFLDRRIGYVCGGDSRTKDIGAVYRTMDGGQTWENISPRMDVFFTTVHFVNDSVGYLTSFDGTIYKTSNAGGPAVPDTINEKPNDTSSFVGKNSLNERDILIYPNPGNEMLNVQLQGTSIEAGKVELRDIRGRILSVHAIDRDLLEINTSRLSSGMYFLHFDTTVGSFLRKWVKE